jgi:hemerythrin superfamily protein
MNAITVLTKDHRKVDELFAQIENGAGDKAQLFKQLHMELNLHAEAEEQLFYPKLELEGDTSSQVQHSYKEHQEVKNLLAELSAMSPDEQAWTSKLLQLKQSVQHHVEEEENELFPQAQTILGDEQLFEIGSKIESMKQKRQKQPHAA